MGELTSPGISPRLWMVSTRQSSRFSLSTAAPLSVFVCSGIRVGPGRCHVRGGAGSVSTFKSSPSFTELNELGTSPPPVCLKCRGCRDCTFRRKRLSPEDQEVVMRVEREMKVDSVSGKITAAYPWKNCVKEND